MHYRNNVAIAGAYWRSEKKEEVMFNVGDTLYDTKGKPYPIKTDIIIAHPNDEGMKLIADEIFKNIGL